MNRSAFRASALALVLVGTAALPSMADGPLHYYTLSPCRVADTRSANGLNGGPILSSGVERAFKIQGLCNVPLGAKAVQLNVTAVTPGGAGYLSVYPSGIATPGVSNINFATDYALANSATVALADYTVYPNDLKVYAAVGGTATVHVVLDVAGYYK